MWMWPVIWLSTPTSLSLANNDPMQKILISFINILRFVHVDFSTDPRFSVGFKFRDWDRYVLQWFLCWFGSNFGSSCCWKLYLCPGLNLLAEAPRLWAEISWYIAEFMMPSIFTRASSWTNNQKNSLKENWYSIILYSGQSGAFPCMQSHFVAKSADAVHDWSVWFWSQLKNDANYSSGKALLRSGDAFCDALRKGFFLAMLQNHLLKRIYLTIHFKS